MGRRKSKRKPGPKKKNIMPLDTMFNCPFCNHEKSCEVNQTKHLFILVPAPLWHLICTNILQWWRKRTFLDWFGANLALKKIYPEMHLLKGLFGMKLMSTKALKKHHICPISTFLAWIRCRFVANFNWGNLS